MAELRHKVLLEGERTGETIESICARYGIGKTTYYRYRRRYLLDGIAGLEDRSRAPHHSPARMDPQIEIAICELRRTHPRWGARRIHAELSRRRVDPPAVSSIHQALRRNGLVADQAPRRQKAFIRFQRDIANDLWQVDATQVALATGKKAWVLDMIDDHSRYLLSAVASPAPTGEAAWDCFEEATSRYGLPRQVLSDNGLCFTGRLHKVEVAFERNLKELGVEMINAGPYHPQTLGKLERFHKTLKLWLKDEGPAEDLAHLQELLDGFRHHYNTERPHQGIDNLTPIERFKHVEASFEAPTSTGVDGNGEPTYPPRSIVRKVSPGGDVSYKDRVIGVGTRFAGARMRVVEIGGLLHIYWAEELIKAVAFDGMAKRTRNTQPSRREERALNSVP